MGAVLSSYQAPWGMTLKVISLFTTVLMFGIAIIGLVGLSTGRGNLVWGLAMIVLPLALLVGGAFFTIRGYVLTPEQLMIQRLGWTTPIPLQNLVAVEADPEAMAKSLRLWGNGGLFSFTGKFRNATLGNYRAYATHLKRCVVLRFQDSVIVVTPDHPDDLVNQLGMLIQK